MDISTLTNTTLLKNTEKLVNKERKLINVLLYHLKEIEVRKLFLDLGHDSIYKYCQKELKLTPKQAFLRVTAARTLHKNPELEESIARGELSLSNISIVETFAKENRLSKDQRKKAFVLAKNKLKTELYQSLKQEFSGYDRSTFYRKLVININKETYQKIKTIQNYKYLEIDLLFSQALDALIEKIDPGNRPIKWVKPYSNSRTPSKNLKALVWRKSKGVCQYPGCESTKNLEVDHIIPYAKGGKTEIDNLRLLCRAHNQKLAIKHFGLKKMRTYS
jgi:hypothetical protein